MNAQSASVLIVDESSALRSSLAACLEERGFTTYTARGVIDGRAILSSIRPDVATIGLGRGDDEGYGLIEEVVRLESRCLAIGQGDQIKDRIRALELGAHDYIAKPVDLEEFFLRVRNILLPRRTLAVTAANPVVEICGIRVDLMSRALQTASGDIGPEMTDIEFALLRILADNQDRIVSKAALFQGVYGRPYPTTTRAIDVAVSRLRVKLKTANVGVDINSVRGIGYILSREAD
jgi:DNA-binding response OmpR family regulator